MIYLIVDFISPINTSPSRIFFSKQQTKKEEKKRRNPTIRRPEWNRAFKTVLRNQIASPHEKQFRKRFSSYFEKSESRRGDGASFRENWNNEHNKHETSHHSADDVKQMVIGDIMGGRDPVDWAPFLKLQPAPRNNSSGTDICIMHA